MKKRVVVALVFALALTALLAGCRRSNWNDGEYRGVGQGYGGELWVNVTVQRGKINAIVVTEHKETPDIAEPAIKQIPERIIKQQNTQVQVVSGATRTSMAIIAAVNTALEPARKR